MAFDGAFLHTVLTQLNSAAGAFVEKIYQPGSQEMLISLKSKGFSAKLLIIARNGGRIGFTCSKPENPQTPPMFCMLARKIFLPSRFLGAEQKGLERIIELNFEASNELGDRVYPKIICEFISGGSNIILTDRNNRIFDAVNRSDITAPRLIMPGAVYEYPADRGKLDPLISTADEIVSAVSKRGGELSAALLSVIDGVSPLVCREVCHMAFGTVEADAGSCDTSLLKSAVADLQNRICNDPQFTVLYENGVPKDFSFMDINQYGALYEKKHFATPGEMLDEFYEKKDVAARIKRRSGDLLKNINNLINRANRRMNLRIKELEAARDREDLRICGELIKANIHKISPGDTQAVVQNFYDENLSLVKIKLDPAKTPAANAAKYFKDYKKSCAAHQSLGALIESDKKEIEYLGSVLYGLENAACLSDISDIREELIEGGYLKAPRSVLKKSGAPRIEEHISGEGYKILVGHNNLQNDHITTRLADKNDTWFHTKGIHGSHVVVKNGGGPLSDQTVLAAARLAAENSKARNSSNVPVDYTQVKYVKKPAGSKAGMVIYTTNKTVYVTPGEK